MMVNYYGIHDMSNDTWPGYNESKTLPTHTQKHAVLLQKIMEEIQRLYPEQNPQDSFIPYFSMHESAVAIPQHALYYFFLNTCRLQHIFPRLYANEFIQQANVWKNFSF